MPAVSKEALRQQTISAPRVPLSGVTSAAKFEPTRSIEMHHHVLDVCFVATRGNRISKLFSPTVYRVVLSAKM